MGRNRRAPDTGTDNKNKKGRSDAAFFLAVLIRHFLAAFSRDNLGVLPCSGNSYRFAGLS